MSTTAPLRIGYVYTRPVPSRETDTQQVLHTVNALSGAGADIDLVLPASYRRLLAKRTAYEAEVRAFYGVENPFRLVPLWTVEPSKVQAERPLHALAAALLYARRYDLVHTRSRAAAFFCVGRRVPTVFETYRRLGHDAPRLARALAHLARSPYFLGIVTHSEESARSLASAGVPEEKLRVLHNGYDSREFEPRLSVAEARQLLSLPPGPLVVYSGNVQRAKGLDTVLDMAAAAPGVSFLIVGGKDADLQLLLREIAHRGLTNVQCPGWRRASELAPYFYAADVLLIPPTSRPLIQHGKTVLPMKVFGYLAAGRPILGPDLPDLREVLTDGENACLVTPDAPESAVAGLRRVLDDSTLAERLARGGLETSAGLTWTARAENLMAQYEAWRASSGL